MLIIGLITALAFSVTAASANAAKSNGKLVEIGWLEYISVGQNPFLMKARIDTGAKTSSIHVKIIKTYKKNDTKYILYSIENHDKKTKTIRSIIRRYASIKTKDGGLVKRPVVRLDFCIDGQKINEEVNLSDRDHMLYPVLVGRNMLANRFLVNSSKPYLKNPDCL